MKTITNLSLNHWKIKQDIEGYLWVYADRADESVNSLSPEMIMEIIPILDWAESYGVPGLGFLSAKTSGFIAGFDIRAFDDFMDDSKLAEALANANHLLNRIENLSFPTACGIDGFCMGGGLELALVCRYRVARNDDKTRLGLPEVKLGLHPGFGGTMRLCRLIGGKDAVPLMLTGKAVRASAARRLGIVDKLVGVHENIQWSMRKMLVRNAPARKATVFQGLSNSTLARKVIAPIMVKETAKKANREHYPAPYAIIDLWRKYGDNWSQMMDQEGLSFAKLMDTATATNLRRVFHLMEALKAQGKDLKFKPRRVHVIGAGVMGGDIAAWCALRGYEVTLQDRAIEYIEPALQRAKKLFGKRLKTSALRQAANARLIPDVAGNGTKRADVVIEAIIEDLGAKQELFSKIEPELRSDTILATNTSALPLEELASSLKRPGQFIGLHFFNPVAALPLVEVIQAQSSDTEIVKRGAAFVNAIGKFPLIANSAPGFVVNRVLSPYLIEALKASTEGFTIEDIDRAAVTFGMPMGPMELADQIGLDVCVHVTKTLGKLDELSLVEAKLNPMINAGKLGKKTGEGNYLWQNGKPVRTKSSGKQSKSEQMELAERLIKPLLTECQSVLNDGVVENADLLDAGVIFGTGFAPFHGGPLHYQASKQGN